SRRGALQRRGVPNTTSSCAGLTRASINLQKTLAKKMDGRVKPGHDGFVFGPGSAERHEECRTASGTGLVSTCGKPLPVLEISTHY
ncbi:MAG TPA: hypothetical protein VFQ87_05400, partial [Bradyrhizobium sp.]|nr:hypothetical protein [Bradyrhizobium sp.]